MELKEFIDKMTEQSISTPYECMYSTTGLTIIYFDLQQRNRNVDQIDIEDIYQNYSEFDDCDQLEFCFGNLWIKVSDKPGRELTEDEHNKVWNKFKELIEEDYHLVELHYDQEPWWDNYHSSLGYLITLRDKSKWHRRKELELVYVGEIQ